MTTRNYLSLRMGDNDYGEAMRCALQALIANFGVPGLAQLDPSHDHYPVVMLVSGLQRLRHRDSIGSDIYVDSRLRIIFSETAPNWDTDGGTVSIDLNTGYIWFH